MSMKQKMYVKIGADIELLSLPTPMRKGGEVLYVCMFYRDVKIITLVTKQGKVRYNKILRTINKYIIQVLRCCFYKIKRIKFL